MLLVVDQGNTNTVVGLFKEKYLVAHWRISTNKNRTPDEYSLLFFNMFGSVNLSMQQVTHSIIASVVPPSLPALIKGIRQSFNIEPIIAKPGINIKFPILYENPKEVGADRIINAIAGVEEYQTPLIIVDFGTATTFDAISEKGEYIGGVIAPGVKISAEALFQKASKLPRVSITKPPKIIGTNTVRSIQSGIFYGYLGLVEGIINNMKKEFNKEPFIIATGGLAPLFEQKCPCFDVVDTFLTLKGLRITFDKYLI